MRAGGFPCRATQSCDEVFAVADQNSMHALQDASALRSEHEREAHQYEHVALTTAPPRAFSAISAKPRAR